MRVVPSPNWPEPFHPQHLTAPPAVTAQVWNSPAATALTPLPSPLTSIGVACPVVVPSPNWPTMLSPQHLSPPPFVTAQVWDPPAATTFTPLPSPLTSTGVVCLSVVPFPNWPEPLFPQHLSPPPRTVSIIAQVWSPPAATPLTPLASPLTSVGTLRSPAVPSPNWP